ncbi:hypothetical protein CPB83DRAFT_894993 [Crepidotus variabilis]|uniref:LCCL domain-containing protein n=1 Tax=Crepidotus variabilis TaxID=179855 RepID=A0A9P6EE53_9AGAR|nr:hypothetical protein CPB83DRAFT_894993 [Crepidotus variabilis]
MDAESTRGSSAPLTRTRSESESGLTLTSRPGFVTLPSSESTQSHYTAASTTAADEKGYEGADTGIYELAVRTPELGSESESELVQVQPRRKTWVSKVKQSVARRYPSTYTRIRRVVLYVRGPRPKVDLPPPTPLLNISLRLSSLHISLPLEFTLLKHTSRLTSPYLFTLLSICYITSLALLSRSQSFQTPPSSYLTCLSTYWLANSQCGVDGRECGPFDERVSEFRCPAQCENTILQNPRMVGGEEIKFVPLIVGGGDEERTYRGDSFICASAVQAGIISKDKGGCGSVHLIGNYTNFLPYTAHGLSSIGFPSIFPYSFRFLSTPSSSPTLSHCTDYRTPALAYNILITTSLFLLFRPSPLTLFFSLICIGFWHVALFSQPHGPPPKLDVAFGAFLPALFVAYAFWRVAVRFVMPLFVGGGGAGGMSTPTPMPIESCILYLVGFWIGVLHNLTLDKLPLSRLTSSDITKRSGAISVLVIGLIVVVICVFNQLRVIRTTGWLGHYVKWYAAGGIVLLVMAFLPGLSLRLHHYIVPMMVLPMTAFPTRLSVVYQGLCIGLFLNGVAAFGFDGILQSLAVLKQDAISGSGHPTFLTNSTNFNASIPLMNQTLRWSELLDSWDGFALLIDDVERYAGAALEFSLSALDPGIPHFFRVAYTNSGTPGDFTNAATYLPNGTWVDALPGASY